MPEALTTILPKLQMLPCTGQSSEADSAPNTERSSSSTNANPSFEPNDNKKSLQNNKKSRKLMGRRSGHNVKKLQLKSNTLTKPSTKAVASLQVRSHIPRALLLTPSSSSTSLSTNTSDSSRALVAVKPNSSSPNSSISLAKPRVSLQRQNTATILSFRFKKSVSQMDFKHVHRKGGLRIPISQPRMGDSQYNNNALAVNKGEDGKVLGVSTSQTSLMTKMFKDDGCYYMMQERDPKAAATRIFAMIMLNAWRKRRDEVKRLMDEVADLKKVSIKSKNQLHVYNSLFRVEQKRNNELSSQLRRSMEDITNTKTSCETLTTSLISIKADKALLEQQLIIKDQEYESLNTILAQTKTELFKAMTLQRELQTNLSMEQRKVQLLENQKNDLINEIYDLNNDNQTKSNELRAELESKEKVVVSCMSDIKSMEHIIFDLKKKELQISNFIDAEKKMKSEIEMLQANVNSLRQCLSATVGNRLKGFWFNALAYQKSTARLLHWIVFYILPATPPPKMGSFPFGMNLEKALSIVKR